MKLSHFEALSPVCPVCRVAGKTSWLSLVTIDREVHGDVEQGILRCRESACSREYPIIDGIPLLLADLRNYISGQVLNLVERGDLSSSLESLIGDCCGPGSAWDTTRQHLSSYTADHYSDLDPEDGAASSVVSLLDRALELAPSIPDGPVLDIGCSVGRPAFEIGQRLDRLVLGIDLHFAMLRTARRILMEGRVRYPRRRVGLVYDRRDFPVAIDSQRVDFWACDALALPFQDQGFSAVSGFNVLDCVASPAQALAEMVRCLSPGGVSWVTTPYDWSTGATPLEAWLGGHSQRGGHEGRGEPLLRALLTDDHPPGSSGAVIHQEDSRLPWKVRLHDRSTMVYEVDMVVFGRQPST